MKPDDIKKMQEVASRCTKEYSMKFMEENKYKIDKAMQQLNKKEIEEERLALEDLTEKERNEAFMVLS